MFSINVLEGIRIKPTKSYMNKFYTDIPKNKKEDSMLVPKSLAYLIVVEFFSLPWWANWHGFDIFLIESCLDMTEYLSNYP